jgi:hypothetical protein
MSKAKNLKQYTFSETDYPQAEYNLSLWFKSNESARGFAELILQQIETNKDGTFDGNE